MYILLFGTLLCTIILFSICYKKIDNNQSIYDQFVSPLLKRIGENDILAKDILKYIGNYNTVVEKNKDKNIKSSFYNYTSNKIVIKQTEDLEDCSRVVHISHECIHSVQDKKILKIHFIMSNIQILYFLGIFIYFFYNSDMNLRLILLLIQLFIFIITFFIKVVLESDATYRAVDLAIEYLSSKISREELQNFKKTIEENLYKMVPFSYFSLYSQGAMLLIITQIGAISI